MARRKKNKDKLINLWIIFSQLFFVLAVLWDFVAGHPATVLIIGVGFILFIINIVTNSLR